MQRIAILGIAFTLCLSMVACSTDADTSEAESSSESAQAAPASSVSSSATSRSAADTSKSEAAPSSSSTASTSASSSAPNEANSLAPSNENPNTEKAPTFKSYQEMLSAAESLEAYLRLKLSTEDYGGMYIWQQETVTIDLWVVNRDTIDSVLQSYSDKKVDINFKKARCSLGALTKLSDQMKAIRVHADESLNIYISESDNSIAVNISKNGADRLKDEISTLVKSSGLPSECVVVFVIDPNGENPVT